MVFVGIISSDFHIPYQDKKSLKIIIKVINYIKKRYPLRFFVINGDFCDCYAVSRFDQNPERALKAQEEYDKAKHILKRLTSPLPSTCKKIYVEGNHEHRFQKDRWKHPGVYNLRCYTIEELLDLKKYGYEFIRLGQSYKRRKFHVYHGNIARKHSGFSAKGEMEDTGLSGITGHTHRGSLFMKSDMSGDKVHAEGFCMCRNEAGNDYIKGNKNWQRGFIVVFEEKTTGDFQIVPVQIKNGKAFFNGKIFKA